jgi:hypothetical protein
MSRIEDAIDGLYTRGILGAPPKYLSPIDRTKSRWTGDWLASQVQLVPPGSIVEHYHRSLVAFPQVIEAPTTISSSNGKQGQRKATKP